MESVGNLTVLSVGKGVELCPTDWHYLVDSNVSALHDPAHLLIGKDPRKTVCPISAPFPQRATSSKIHFELTSGNVNWYNLYGEQVVDMFLN